MLHLKKTKKKKKKKWGGGRGGRNNLATFDFETTMGLET